MHGCAISTVATDHLMLKHQAISNQSADNIFIVLDQFEAKILHMKNDFCIYIGAHSTQPSMGDFHLHHTLHWQHHMILEFPWLPDPFTESWEC